MRRAGERGKAIGKTMITLIKAVAGMALALCILSPGSSPKADTCECKAKSKVMQLAPRADTCECKAKKD